ncbi:TBC1 domain family member 24 isoform X1 [Tetranychus urticae]|uniref:TBC1 domain family member 24 isoform X1 n=1 Tax=Tetranychus urticae TaxID=32264 RepID=UPI00077BB4C2|nr:TBC1 domain family member 24 isoform X1 [Tetranychus urticae]
MEPLEDLVRTRNQRKLKSLCRTRLTIDSPIRQNLWPILCSAYKVGGRSGELEAIEASLHPIGTNEYLPEDCPRKLPSFIDPNYCRYFKLSPDGQRLVERILWILACKHNEITICPLLYPIAALFLHYHDITQTLTSLTYLLEAPSSGIGGKDGPYLLPQSRTQIVHQAYVLLRLTNKFGFLPRRGFFTEQRERLIKENEMDACFLDWLKWIFIGLPFEHVIRIMDCFLVEGTKFLYRIGLTLLLLYKNSRPVSPPSRLGMVTNNAFNNFKSSTNINNGSSSNFTSTSTTTTNTTLTSSSSSSSPFTLDLMLSFCETIKLTPDELITVATQLRRLSRAKIDRTYKEASHRNEKFKIRSAPSSPYHHLGYHDLTPTSPRKLEMISLDSVKITDCTRIAPRSLKSSICDWQLLDILWDWIPERTLIKEPVIIFCSDVHGNSLSTFYDKNEAVDQSILLIKTLNNEIFGAFCSTSWSDRLGADRKGAQKQYFGTGETFLFTLKPKVAYYPWVGTKEYGSDQTKNIPCSCQLFMAANSKMITIGAGNGVGLWLDENLTKGKTEQCDTFNNKPLCTSGDFACSIVEVIGFISSW